MLHIILPAYNEELSIEPLVTRISDTLAARGIAFRLLVCNDGSTDATADRLRDISARVPLDVITHTRNRGLGETIRDLIEEVADRAEPGDVVIRMDCDDTHDPQYIPAMIAKLDEGHDVVIASRFRKGGGQMGVYGLRAVLSYGANLFMGLFFPTPGVRDFTCGYRAYRAAILKRALAAYGRNFIQLQGVGFTCTLEKLVKLRLVGARFAEIPFLHRYDRKASPSKMIANLTTLGYLLMVLLCYWPWGGWRWARYP